MVFSRTDVIRDEGVWNWLKRVAFKNQSYTNLSSLERPFFVQKMIYVLVAMSSSEAFVTVVT